MSHVAHPLVRFFFAPAVHSQVLDIEHAHVVHWHFELHRDWTEPLAWRLQVDVQLHRKFLSALELLDSLLSQLLSLPPL